MLTCLSTVLRHPAIFKNPSLGNGFLSHICSAGKPFHSLAPGVTILSQHLPACSASTFSHNNVAHKSSWSNGYTNTLLFGSNPCLRVADDAASSLRGFSTSACKAAKELSDKGDLVYTGAISGMIKGVKLFSLSTSVIGVCLQPMFIFSNQELPTGLKLAFGGIINFFVFMNPFIIHYIAKKYVTELHWNRSTDVFTAVTYSFFIQRRELQFTADDVVVPTVPGMFTFLEAKGTPLFLDPQGFRDNESYIHLMGFDKPLDWELPSQPDQVQKEETQKR